MNRFLFTAHFARGSEDQETQRLFIVWALLMKHAFRNKSDQFNQFYQYNGF